MSQDTVTVFGCNQDECHNKTTALQDFGAQNLTQYWYTFQMQFQQHFSRTRKLQALTSA